MIITLKNTNNFWASMLLTTDYIRIIVLNYNSSTAFMPTLCV